MNAIVRVRRTAVPCDSDRARRSSTGRRYARQSGYVGPRPNSTVGCRSADRGAPATGSLSAGTSRLLQSVLQVTPAGTTLRGPSVSIISTGGTMIESDLETAIRAGSRRRAAEWYGVVDQGSQ